MCAQLWRKEMFWVIWFGVFLVLMVFGFQIAQAAEFPAKPVTLVIPVGAGGGLDLTARALSSVAPDYLGQPLIIQLKPGGGGVIGSDYVAKAAPDGYTLLFSVPAMSTTLPAIEGRSKGPDDLVAVCRINYMANFLLAHPDAPFKTFKEMIEWAKANPGKLTSGHTGIWGAADLPWKQIKQQTGIVSRDVPHDGGGPCLIALLGGQIHVACIMGTQGIPQVKSGKLRPLGFLDDKRDKTLPDVPTLKEQGVNVTYFLWKGILAPKGMPRPVIDKLAVAFKKMTEDSSFISMLKQFGDDIQYLGPDEFTKVWREEYEAHKEIGRAFKK